MGYINKILPPSLKPISRDFGFLLYSFFYIFKSAWKKPHPMPIFILGNQKSGTSAIATLLGKLTANPTAVDLFYSGYNFKLFKKWKSKEISTFKFVSKNKLEFSKKIIKEPHLSVFYTELKEEFPNAKFVMIIRNPFDNIRSILDRLNIDGDKDFLKNSDKNKIFHSWNLLFNNSWIGAGEGHYIEVLAERWNIIYNSYFENKEDIILIKYEDFLKDKIGVLNKLSIELGLKNITDISSILNNQFQPKGKNRKIDSKDFFGKTNYQKIENICKDNLMRFKY